MDDRYHTAKLTAAAFGEPGQIWEEHAEFRASVLTAPAVTMSRDDIEAQILRHFQRPQPTGAN